MEQLPIIPIKLFMPEKATLATYLQATLSEDFKEVKVEWVNCPNLIQKFRPIGTPGLCGDTALLDIGNISNLFPSPKRTKIYYFKKILEELGRTKSSNFIIGGGLCKSPSNYLAELIMDASFSPASEEGIGETITVNNQSHYASQIVKKEKLQKNHQLKSLPNIDSCIMYGNFFVSQGRREQVLKIWAKKERTDPEFIDALQHAISQFSHKNHSQLIGLGGTFTVNNGLVVHHVIQNDWFDKQWIGSIKNKKDMQKCIQLWKVNTPVVAFATCVSADRYIVNDLKEIFLTKSRVYSYSKFAGGQYRETIQKQNRDQRATEYLGYFSLATKLYRIDPVPSFAGISDFLI